MGSYKKTVASLVHGDVVDFHRTGEACVCDPCHHKDLVIVDGDTKQGTGRLHGSQVLPLKLSGVVDTHSSHAFPA